MPTQSKPKLNRRAINTTGKYSTLEQEKIKSGFQKHLFHSKKLNRHLREISLCQHFGDSGLRHVTRVVLTARFMLLFS